MQKGETATDALHSSCDRHIKKENIMTYSTVLTLPDWATEAQAYSQQVIRFTPIVLKALSKTIAPVTIASIKGFSNHWFESECYWRQRITNLAGITYNPLTASISAAHAELTSTEAQATYRRLQHITRETAMDALVIGLCGVVAIAQGVEVAQKVYRTAKRVYDWVDARLNPSPANIPSVGKAFAMADEKAIAAIVEEVRYEQYFLSQFDQLDSDILAINAEEIDEAIAQVKAQQLKCDRAAMVLQMEGDRLAREALASVVDRAVADATAETVQRTPQATAASAVAEDCPANALNVPGATGKGTFRALAGNSKTGTKAEPKTSAGKSRGVAMGKR
jgi:hypothetical protein